MSYPLSWFINLFINLIVFVGLMLALYVEVSPYTVFLLYLAFNALHIPHMYFFLVVKFKSTLTQVLLKSSLYFLFSFSLLGGFEVVGLSWLYKLVLFHLPVGSGWAPICLGHAFNSTLWLFIMFSPVFYWEKLYMLYFYKVTSGSVFTYFILWLLFVVTITSIMGKFELLYLLFDVMTQVSLTPQEMVSMAVNSKAEAAASVATQVIQQNTNGKSGPTTSSGMESVDVFSVGYTDPYNTMSELDKPYSPGPAPTPPTTIYTTYYEVPPCIPVPTDPTIPVPAPLPPVPEVGSIMGLVHQQGVSVSGYSPPSEYPKACPGVYIASDYSMAINTEWIPAHKEEAQFYLDRFKSALPSRSDTHFSIRELQTKALTLEKKYGNFTHPIAQSEINLLRESGKILPDIYPPVVGRMLHAAERVAPYNTPEAAREFDNAIISNVKSYETYRKMKDSLKDWSETLPSKNIKK